MPEAIAAIVVTYNRKELLVECLEALRVQSRPLARIFVIDNASTDGTTDLLSAHGLITDNQFEYVRMLKNSGGAGGFHEGLSRAYQAGYDWFWLMDDDVEPYKDGLERLLRYHSRSGCIHGRRMSPDNTPVSWGEHFEPNSVTTVPIRDQLFQSGQDAQEVTVGCFEGMLVNREVVQQIGFPDPALFIGWDDTFYGYLASRVTPVLYVNVFALRRKRPLICVASPLFGRRILCKQSPLTLYYTQRNRFLIAQSLSNYSSAFAWASIRILLRSTLREILVFRSARGAIAVFRGFLDGMWCYIKTPSRQNSWKDSGSGSHPSV